MLQLVGLSLLMFQGLHVVEKVIEMDVNNEHLPKN
jgi:hypothetical protein